MDKVLTVLECGGERDKYIICYPVGSLLSSVGILDGASKTVVANPNPQKASRVMQAMLRMVKLDIQQLKDAHAC